jgi:hypothetical protein
MRDLILALCILTLLALVAAFAVVEAGESDYPTAAEWQQEIAQ